MDNLEKFIRENRNSLDRYEPSPDVWNRIQVRNGFFTGKMLIRVAAAACFLLILGTAAVIYRSRSNNEKLSSLPGEVREMELFYNTTASTLYMQAKPLLVSQPDLEKELNNDLSTIDNICSDIKKDLKDNVSNQEVIEALIRNYTIKIRILEDMLNTLKENENKNEKSKKNEL